MLEEAKQSVHQLIIDIAASHGLEVSEDTELLLSGILDSLDVIRVASSIEKSLNIEVSPMDITIENFESITAIYGYIATRLKAS